MPQLELRGQSWKRRLHKTVRTKLARDSAPAISFRRAIQSARPETSPVDPEILVGPSVSARENFRDDVYSHLRNSGVSLEQIAETSGLHITTLRSWENKKVICPQTLKAKAALNAVGLDIVITKLRT